MNDLYAKAYSEVLEILQYIPKNQLEKIPQKILNLFDTHRDKNWKFKYNPNKTLDEQNVSKYTKYIIAVLFREYWATPEEKIKILQAKKDYFKSINNKVKKDKITKLDIVKYQKENLFDKILKYFKINKMRKKS